MPLPQYKGRYAEIYFPSPKFLERWQSCAKASRSTLSAWIFETVEASLDGATEPAQEINAQKASLQEENRALRRDLEKSDARLKELETEIFKLRNEVFQQQLKGAGVFDPKVASILRVGGVWSNRELLKELAVDPHDIEAIEIVTRQLQALQDLGIVTESAKGWRWVG